MGLPVKSEPPLEERVARIEAGVEHICREISETKVDIRELRADVKSMDVRLSDKISEVDKRLCARIEEVDRRLSAKIDELIRSLHSAKVWALILYIGLAATLLGAMARGYSSLEERQQQFVLRQDEMRKELILRQDEMRTELSAEMQAGFADLQARLKSRAPGS